MAVNSADIYWIAGLIEGEGCFTRRKGSSPRSSPIIQIIMTDKDVVIRAAQILGAAKVIKSREGPKRDNRPSTKDIYRVVLYGRRAVSWCMTLYPIMGERRQARIRELLDEWKKSPRATYLRKRCVQRCAEIVWQNPNWVNVAA